MAAFLTGLPVLVAAFLASRSWLKAVPIAIVLAILGLIPLAPELLEANRKERAPIIYKHWDAMAKIKIFNYEGGYRGINIDNVANSPVGPFDGDWDKVEGGVNPYGWGIDVGYLIKRFPSPARVKSIYLPS